MPKLWFAAKRYGYGWYPVTWEGWLTVLLFVALLLLPTGLAPWIGPPRYSESAFAAAFVCYAAVLTCVLLFVCVKKGEPARWRWGGK
ncbi:MAG TPA: hypothetical protein PKV72_05260 [Candidatus Peribacteria bacterium]|nr:hypothetical protein [Candidatus Peribacteria bacterium]